MPCMASDCNTHYTSSLLGPTFYSPQQPYKFARKKGFCPAHANRDLKAANERAKRTFETMRQNAGRKTLGLIAAEFELWTQELEEERDAESQELEAQQRRKVLGAEAKGKKKKGKAVYDADWDWRYAPRPCTRKGCGKDWYSPFDNRLYLFYHTSRSSSLLPLSTLCPSCARADVEALEDRIEAKRMDADELVWIDWVEQIRRDREMESVFWESAQERVVREKGVNSPAAAGKNEKKGSGGAKKGKKESSKGVCVVM